MNTSPVDDRSSNKDRTSCMAGVDLTSRLTLEGRGYIITTLAVIPIQPAPTQSFSTQTLQTFGRGKSPDITRVEKVDMPQLTLIF